MLFFCSCLHNKIMIKILWPCAQKRPDVRILPTKSAPGCQETCQAYHVHATLETHLHSQLPLAKCIYHRLRSWTCVSGVALRVNCNPKKFTQYLICAERFRDRSLYATNHRRQKGFCHSRLTFPSQFLLSSISQHLGKLPRELFKPKVSNAVWLRDTICGGQLAYLYFGVVKLANEKCRWHDLVCLKWRHKRGQRPTYDTARPRRLGAADGRHRW